MTDFIEIDFIEAGETKSGDAIAIRHRVNGGDYVHVVDGGYALSGSCSWMDTFLVCDTVRRRRCSFASGVISGRRLCLGRPWVCLSVPLALHGS